MTTLRDAERRVNVGDRGTITEKNAVIGMAIRNVTEKIIA